MTTTNEPLSVAEADAVLACLAPFSSLTLAVSGGPDSLALLALVQDWRLRQRDAPKLDVVTVDHRLRPQSAGEAAAVARLCEQYGLSHQTLVWRDAKPATGLMAAAREARYRLIANHIQHKGPPQPQPRAIVTAHHLDDQAETFVMRLGRGSGVDGLQAMRTVRPLTRGGSIMLLRPLLALPKARLEATAVAFGLTPALDPANEDARYERPRLRRALPALAEAGLTPAALALSASRIAEAVDAVAYAEAVFLDRLAIEHVAGTFARIEAARFDQGPRLLRVRVLSHLIETLGGASVRPRLIDREALADELAASHADGGWTLGGVCFRRRGGVIESWREYGRIASDPVPLQPDQRVLWDDRFWISRAGPAEAEISVAALGAEGYRAVPPAERRWTGIPMPAVHALPSFWSAGQLLAVVAPDGVQPLDFVGNPVRNWWLRADPARPE